MVASCEDEFSWGSDNHSYSYQPIISPTVLNSEQESIARDLDVHSLGWDVFSHARRARMIRQHIEWILDDNEDFTIKQIVWFLEQKYKYNLLRVVEQALPYLAFEHGESHPEFPMLRAKIEKLREHVRTLT